MASSVLSCINSHIDALMALSLQGEWIVCISCSVMSHYINSHVCDEGHHLWLFHKISKCTCHKWSCHVLHLAILFPESMCIQEKVDVWINVSRFYLCKVEKARVVLVTLDRDHIFLSEVKRNLSFTIVTFLSIGCIGSALPLATCNLRASTYLL